MKKANRLINIIMGAMAAFFVGYSGYECIFYLRHSSDYMLYSAPWYTGIILCGILIAVIEIILVVIKIVMRFALKEKQEEIGIEGEK